MRVLRAVLTRDEMRAADAAALASVSHETLVQRAGTAVAHRGALRLLGGAYGRRVVVVAGKGSNGKDGRVAAAVLTRRGARVSVLEAEDIEPGPRLPPCDLVVDGAYGTGFHGTYNTPAAPPGAAVLAIDIPSGVDADTGEAPGDAVRADRTVTFAALKPGSLPADGARLSGTVQVADIGMASPPRRCWSRMTTWRPSRPGRDSQQVDDRRRRGGRIDGHGGRRDPVHERGDGGRGGDDPLGNPGHPGGNWPTEAVRMTGRGIGRGLPRGDHQVPGLVIGPGLGTGDAVAEEIRFVIVAAPSRS